MPDRPERPTGVGAPVIAQIAFTLPPSVEADFRAAAGEALGALAAAAGFRRGRVARALDAPRSWLLVTEWDGPGPWRRALSGFDVRRILTPLLAYAVDAPGAFEVLAAVDGPAGIGGPASFASDRAVDDVDPAAPGADAGRDGHPAVARRPGAGRDHKDTPDRDL